MHPLARLPDRAVLELTGADRVGFLQGLVSNDVALAAPGRLVWSALLTPQGKWLAEFFIGAAADRLLLDVDAALAPMVAQRLARYRLRADVQIAPTPLHVAAGWDGPAPDGAALDPRLPDAGWRLVAATLPTDTSTPEAYELHRLRLGLPGTADMESEKTTLLEAGYDELHGVSWTKGCYMGQELTARTKYRGLLKRRLVPVRIEGTLPEPGTPVLADGAEVGQMRSGRDDRGLALLRLDALDRALTSYGARLHPEPAAWMQLHPVRLASPA